MRIFFRVGTVVLFSAFFFACLEEDAMPVPFPLPPPSAQQTTESALPPPSTEPAPVDEVPKAPKVTTPAPAAEPKSVSPSVPTFISTSSDAEQLKSGRYTIQIAVFPNEASARKLVKKMSDNGIKSYYVKVNNPAQLLGTYYRVRVGYFSGKSSAENFARAKLEPLGYAWYVDGSRNDTIGNPAAASVAPVAPKTSPAPVTSSTPAASSAPAPSAANAELEKAKQEYKEIAKQAQAAKQATPPAPPPPPKAPPPPPPPPPPKAVPKVDPPPNW